MCKKVAMAVANYKLLIILEHIFVYLTNLKLRECYEKGTNPRTI